jgi:hypothetical protein
MVSHQMAVDTLVAVLVLGAKIDRNAQNSKNKWQQHSSAARGLQEVLVVVPLEGFEQIAPY